MRLLNVRTRRVESFLGRQIPPYAILSHTWGEEEVQFDELESASAQGKAGNQKIRSACTRAREDGHSYVWIDTCCIDKRSSAELSEAINSMFKWYGESEVCYAYLEDVDTLAGLESARWFTRGWTLQELLSPAHVIFYSRDWQLLGTKDDLAPDISRITGIHPHALCGLSPLDYIRNTSIARRMSWASARETTRDEDIAYCLLGLFDVNMPLLYGEGEKAFLRLQEEIMRVSSDQSLLAWSLDPGYSVRGILASHPRCFARSSNIVPTGSTEGTYHSYDLSNQGLRMRLPMLRREGKRNRHVGVLACVEEGQLTDLIGLPLTSVERKEEMYFRDSPSLVTVKPFEFRYSQNRDVCILRRPACVAAKPQLLLVRELPAAGSGLALARLKASHGHWDVKSRTIEIAPASCSRVYKLLLQAADGPSLTVLVGLMPQSRYSARVHISSTQAPSSMVSAGSDPQRVYNHHFGAHHNVRASISWHFIHGREVLALDLQLLDAMHPVLVPLAWRPILLSIWALLTAFEIRRTHLRRLILTLFSICAFLTGLRSSTIHLRHPILAFLASGPMIMSAWALLVAFGIPPIHLRLQDAGTLSLSIYIVTLTSPWWRRNILALGRRIWGATPLPVDDLTSQMAVPYGDIIAIIGPTAILFASLISVNIFIPNKGEGPDLVTLPALFLPLRFWDWTLAWVRIYILLPALGLLSVAMVQPDAGSIQVTILLLLFSPIVFSLVFLYPPHRLKFLEWQPQLARVVS